MRLSRLFSRPRPGLRERVAKALQQAGHGDIPGAIETISERFPEALDELRARRQPVDAAWLRLAAWLAYRAGDMPASDTFASRSLALDEDGQTWNLRGRLALWMRDAPTAQAAFAKAASLEPRRFVRPYRIRRERFLGLAEKALAGIPDTFQARLTNTMIVVEDLPDLEAVREGEDPDLLGLYEGATVLEHGLPERIVLYQRNHENLAADAAELEGQVNETMRHEIGHHFGMTEDELPY